MRLIDELRRALRDALCAWDETNSLTQHHPDLSPVAWHVGHAAFVESHWLRERLLGHAPDLDGWHAVYFPELAPKAGRANTLPPRAELLAWFDDQARRNEAAWTVARSRWARHGLISSDYLESFLEQHQCQHLETIAQVQHARACGAADTPTHRLDQASGPADDWVELDACTLRLGALQTCGSRAPYDNELGDLRHGVSACQVARQPVSNAQWLGFIQDRGYQRPELWSEAGWAWRQAHGIEAPQGWRLNGSGARIVVQEIPPPGADIARAAVSGISWHEAQAHARWAGGTLPDEHQWLAARQTGQLDGLGQAWEWCANALDTFPGFRAFPYDRYTLPWCDGQHRVLKGGSVHTRPPVRRDSFRNFYTADARHVFAGVRLVRASGPSPGPDCDHPPRPRQ